MARPKKKKEVPGITENFINEVNSMDTNARKARIVTLQFQIDESLDFLKTNDKVLEAKAELANATGPTKETLKILRNQTKFIIDQLNGKDNPAENLG